MEVWIGTSGYSYPDWLGEFYPPNLRNERMLGFYAQHFPLVEVNFTYYRPPTPGMMHRLAEKAPAGFAFLVKAPGSLTHEKDERDVPVFRESMEVLSARGQLLGVLAQCPQSLHNTREERGWVRRLAACLGGLGTAVEFRHRSWAEPEVPAWLAGLGLDLVAVDAPNIPSLYPRGWVQAGRRVYVRLHSRNGEKWYAGEKERYDYDYDDSSLQEWVDAAREHDVLGDTDRALFLFNNCHRGQAVVNARRLRTLLEQQVPGIDLVGAFGAPPPVQRSLFEVEGRET